MKMFIFANATMPISTSTYKPPLLFQNGHFSTIYSAKFRIAPKIKQTRERLSLSDGDFLDIDWSFAKQKTNRILLLLHGLEGNAQRAYIKGIASLANNHGWDALAVNYRGCSGEPNKLFRSYNAGATDDLKQVIQHVLEKDNYSEIALNGFSLGGNLMLKFLGEEKQIPKEIKSAVAVSTPLALQESLEELNKRHNVIYATSFLRDLKKKIKQKARQFPENDEVKQLQNIKSLFDFDNIYTSKAHGFKDAYEYYRKNSCLQFLPQIQIPVLLLQAANDSFLSPSCYPVELAAQSKTIFLETPKYGGHVGFYDKNNIYYNEKRTVQFILNH